MDALDAKLCVSCRWIHQYYKCPRCGEEQFTLIEDLIKVMNKTKLDKLLIRKEREPILWDAKKEL